MSYDELIQELYKKIAIEKLNKNYADVVYNASINADFPNSTSLSSVLSLDKSEISLYVPPKPQNIKNLEPSKQDDQQLLEYNLQKLFSPQDSITIASSKLISDENMVTINTFFQQFTQSINGVQFQNTNSVIQYLIAFSDKLNNKTNVKDKTNKPNKPVNKPDDKPDKTKLLLTSDNLPLVNVSV